MTPSHVHRRQGFARSKKRHFPSLSTRASDIQVKASPNRNGLRFGADGGPSPGGSSKPLLPYDTQSRRCDNSLGAEPISSFPKRRHARYPPLRSPWLTGPRSERLRQHRADCRLPGEVVRESDASERVVLPDRWRRSRPLPSSNSGSATEAVLMSSMRLGPSTPMRAA